MAFLCPQPVLFCFVQGFFCTTFSYREPQKKTYVALWIPWTLSSWEDQCSIESTGSNTVLRSTTLPPTDRKHTCHSPSLCLTWALVFSPMCSVRSALGRTPPQQHNMRFWQPQQRPVKQPQILALGKGLLYGQWWGRIEDLCCLCCMQRAFIFIFPTNSFLPNVYTWIL